MQTRSGTEPVVARELTHSEREHAWSKLLKLNPICRAYQSCTGRQFAVFALAVQEPISSSIPLGRPRSSFMYRHIRRSGPTGRSLSRAVGSVRKEGSHSE